MLEKCSRALGRGGTPVMRKDNRNRNRRSNKGQGSLTLATGKQACHKNPKGTTWRVTIQIAVGKSNTIQKLTRA